MCNEHKTIATLVELAEGAKLSLTGLVATFNGIDSIDLMTTFFCSGFIWRTICWVSGCCRLGAVCVQGLVSWHLCSKSLLGRCALGLSAYRLYGQNMLHDGEGLLEVFFIRDSLTLVLNWHQFCHPPHDCQKPNLQSTSP